jgi:hypothetical protein
VADQSFFDKNSATLQLKSLSGSKSCGCGRRRYLTAHTALTAQHFPHLAPVKPPPPPANGITPGISRPSSPIIEPKPVTRRGAFRAFRSFHALFFGAPDNLSMRAPNCPVSRGHPTAIRPHLPRSRAAGRNPPQGAHLSFPHRRPYSARDALRG